MSGLLKFLEGQWNSSIRLQLVSVPQNGEGMTMHVSFNNMSGGAMFGNFTSVKIVFPSEVENIKESNFVLKIVLPAVIGAIVLVVIVLVVIYLVIRHRRYKTNIFCFLNVIAHLASTRLEYNLIHFLPFDGFVP